MSSVSEIQVSYINKVQLKESQRIKSSSDIATLLFENLNKNTIEVHESFKVILLNNSKYSKRYF